MSAQDTRGPVYELVNTRKPSRVRQVDEYPLGVSRYGEHIDDRQGLSKRNTHVRIVGRASDVIYGVARQGQTRVLPLRQNRGVPVTEDRINSSKWTRYWTHMVPVWQDNDFKSKKLHMSANRVPQDMCHIQM